MAEQRHSASGNALPFAANLLLSTAHIHFADDNILSADADAPSLPAHLHPANANLHVSPDYLSLSDAHAR